MNSTSSIITIGREFGSGGCEIGHKLAEKLGYAYYDYEIVQQIAQESGFAKEYIEENSSELSFNYEMEESNFLGLKSVAQGIFGEVFFIPAVKNINDDLSSNKSSIFTKLYSKVISLITSSDGDIANIKEQVNNQFKKKI